MPKRKALQEERDDLLNSRKEELKKLFSAWKEIRGIRKMGSDAMTQNLGGSVVIEISDERNRNAYFDFLDEIAPQGIRERERQLQLIVEALMPYKLAELVNEKKEDELRAIPGITPGTVTKLLRMPLANLMRLERVRCDDIAQIYLTQDGKKKPLDGLSDGEKCTAVLAVVLLDQSRPLVIDQPEDELDHAFIVSNVVETLGRVKFRHNPTRPNDSPVLGRQFIISTHNQNIPVLGDAELVHKMRKISGEEKCEAETSRGLEHPDIIIHILSLEGGHEAFDRRRQKYLSSIS